MFNASLMIQLADARVQDLHRAAQNDGRGRRVSGTASDVDRSPAAALTALVSRAITGVFDGPRAAHDDAVTIHRFELIGYSSVPTRSARS